MQYKYYKNYLVYEDGKVFSNYTNKFLKGEITKHGYLQYTLTDQETGEQFRIKAHRLVALLFLPEPIGNIEDLVIDHLDCNKLNNHYSNLEWVTIKENNKRARNNRLNNVSASNSNRWKNSEWAEKTSKNISEGLKKSGAVRGKNNPRFRYEIFDKNGKEYNRTELKELLGVVQSTTDAYIKKLANGIIINNKIIKEYGIYVKDTKKES